MRVVGCGMQGVDRVDEEASANEDRHLADPPEPRRHHHLRLHQESRYKATWKREFNLPWLKAGLLKSTR